MTLKINRKEVKTWRAKDFINVAMSGGSVMSVLMVGQEEKQHGQENSGK